MKFGNKTLKLEVRPALQSASTQRNMNENILLVPLGQDPM